MRKIERGDSTTYEVEMRFHYINGQEQLDNVLAGVDKDCFLEIAKIVEPDTLVPLVFFMVKTTEPAINWLKYVVDADLAAQFLEGVRDQVALQDERTAYASDEPDLIQAPNKYAYA